MQDRFISDKQSAKVRKAFWGRNAGNSRMDATEWDVRISLQDDGILEDAIFDTGGVFGV